MLPITLLIALALEITAYLALGRHFMKLDWPQAIAGALNCLLGLRFWINASTWALGMACASPAPPLGFGKRLQIMAGEYFAYLLTFLIIIPFERLWMPADRLGPCPHPILLVHGYGCSRGAWWKLRRRLEAAGHTVASVSLVPPYISIGKLVPQLKARIEEVCAATGARQITLVAHSMGGLVSRSYLARHGNKHVAQLITLATPHAGSKIARFGIGRNAREMEPGSLWLNDMADEALNVPTISLCNLYDNYVMPQNNQRLAGALNLDLPPVGHIALLYNRRVADLLLELLENKP